MPNTATPWYQTFNGKTKLILQVFSVITGIVLGTLWFEGRYAKAADVIEVAEATQIILEVMRIQVESRRAVLELKVASDTITPEQQVELKNIVRAIAKMQ